MRSRTGNHARNARRDGLRIPRFGRTDPCVLDSEVAVVVTHVAVRVAPRRTPKPWGPHPEWAGSSIGRAADS
jgi:hypothetical protein